MTIQIDTSGGIIIDGADTGLKLGQRASGTIVYTPESRVSGQKYQEHTMPSGRYSAAHDNPRPTHATPELAALYKTAGRAQLESDVRELLARIK